MQHCAGFISAESIYMFRAQAPIIRSFKTSTAATGACVIVVGQSSHPLIRAGTEYFYLDSFDKKPKHSSLNQGLFCLNSCRPRLCFADVWIFSLMFSQDLFKSSSSLKFSRATKLFVISIWYYSLTSGSFSFLKFNLCLSNLCAAF